VITSPRNRKVADAARLSKRAMREKDRRFLVEGAQAVGEALASGVPVEVVFHTDRERLEPILGTARESGVEVLEVSDPVMEKLTSTVTPQGLVAVAPFVDTALAELPPDLPSAAILYSVRDPGNAGTVIRSAHAAGAGAVVFAGDTVDVYNPKTVRSSAGSLFHVPVVRDVEVSDAVEGCRSRGLAVYAASGRGSKDLWALDLSKPTAFLFGNEAWGLPDEVADLADETVRVPIEAESLNLAAAATVFLFEAARQRHLGASPGLAQLIAAAAHDIRSPLTAVKGFASTLQKRSDAMTDEQREHMLGAISFDADRLNITVKLLVDAARLASGTLEPQEDLIDVGAIVLDLAAFLDRSEMYPPIRWNGGTVRAFADPDRLRSQIAAMLESSAWWAQEGDIEVEGEVAGEVLTLEVRRAGTVLTSEEADGLFAARAPGTGGGSKIGLYVARGIAHRVGGDATGEVRDGVLVLRLTMPAGGQQG
jgi:TrmH family RNA methyltransferase